MVNQVYFILYNVLVVREPSSFNPKTNPQLDERENINSVRLLFGKGETVYIMDAKSTGNIGRFLNVNFMTFTQQMAIIIYF